MQYFEQGKKIFINDYTPAPVQERRRRERDVIASAEKTYGENSTSFTRAGLTVKGVPYRKLVTPPTPAEIINIDPSLLTKLFKQTTIRSSSVEKEGSIFTAYTAEVKNHQEICNLYIKLKIMVPDAKHIVCAYWVSHPEEFHALDYHDDGEATAGRLLMDFLKANELKNWVVFVAKKYGGSKIGAESFSTTWTQ